MNFWQKLKTPFTVLAPMEGVTDVVFRELITQTAPPDVFFTEFVNVDGILSSKNKVTSRMLEFTPHQHPIVAQIWGLDPAKFKQASQTIAKLGFDGIDINLGCPVKKIIKKGACAAMIGNYPVVSEIISAVKSTGLPVSVKTRLGFAKVMTRDWVSFLLKQDLQALTIHGRIATQMSRGLADWSEIAQAVQIRNQIAPQTKIIGNGDILNFSQIQLVVQKYGVDGVMIGRGVLQNPWVFAPQSIPHATSEYFGLFTKHLQLYQQIYVSDNFDPLKKFVSLYIQGFPQAKSLRQKLMSIKTCSQALDLVS